MKVLVAYMSKTGNTRKVAEAIFEEIHDEKEIKNIDEVDSIEGYDIAFLGFPIHKMGPDKKTITLIEKHCIKGRKVALFITHASPEDFEDLPPMLEKFRQAARGANIVDMFDCQGELARSVKMIMSILPNAQLRSWARQDNSQGQPDQARLDRARAFSRNMMERIHGFSKYDNTGIAANSIGEEMRNVSEKEASPIEVKGSELNQPGFTTKIEYFHASKYGNGAKVAEEFMKQMAFKGVTVRVHHIRDTRANEIPAADLYLFSSPGRFGKPIGDMQRFLKEIQLAPGTKYAVLTTEMAPKVDKKTGQLPTEEEQAKWQKLIPVMNQILQGKGLIKVAEGKIFVTGLKGPLEEGWQKKVEAFAVQIPILLRASEDENHVQLFETISTDSIQPEGKVVLKV